MDDATGQSARHLGHYRTNLLLPLEKRIQRYENKPQAEAKRTRKRKLSAKKARG